MSRLPQMASVTDLRNNYLQLFAMLGAGPVVLASRSKAVAVVVTPEQWNAQADELARLRRIVEADRQFAAMDAGDVVTLTTDMTPA